MLPIDGDHGLTHWARVFENGLWLCETTGGCTDVVSLFAVFHDSRRINECTDPDHGLRGAEFAAELCGELFELSDHKFELLFTACEGHTRERTHPNITVQTCWDSDRLDLGRVGITPHPRKLCTDAAKSKDMLRWADGRGSFRYVPSLIADTWGIDVPATRIW